MNINTHVHHLTCEYEADCISRSDFGFILEIHRNHGIDVCEIAGYFVSYYIDTISCLWYTFYTWWVPLSTEMNCQVRDVPRIQSVKIFNRWENLPGLMEYPVSYNVW